VALRSKRSRAKRLAPEKLRPITPQKKYADLPPEKGVNRMLITVFAFSATLALLTYGEPPLDIRAGEVARRHYISRVDFDCEDRQKTEEKRATVRNDELTVYVEDKSAAGVMKDALIKLLRAEPKAGKEAKPEKGGIPPAEIAAAAAAVKDISEKQLREKLSRIFRAMVARCIIAKDDRNDEAEVRHRLYINVSEDPSAKPRRVPIYHTLTPGTPEMREFISAQVRTEFPELSPPEAKAVATLIYKVATMPTIRRSDELTEKAKEAAAKAVPSVYKHIKVGDVILASGHIASRQDILELETERKEFARMAPPAYNVKRFLGNGVVVFLAFVLITLYVFRFGEQLMRSNNLLFMVTLVCLLMLAAGKFVAVNGWPILSVPLPFAAITFSLVLGQRSALLLTTMLAGLMGLVDRSDFGTFATFAMGGAVAVFATSVIRHRSKLIQVGLLSGITLCITSLSMTLIRGYDIPLRFWESPAAWDAGIGILNGVAVGFIMTGILPYVEKLFGVVTDISLLEWSDLNQPILRKLVIAAPGTYHHSIIVGNLVDEAAASVGCNALLARVGAYFHDIGKLNKPDYFVENTPNGTDKHSKLSPTLSALIITAHTKDGLELADEYNVPDVIKDIIEQHHGTTVVEYFYKKAQELNGDNGPAGGVDPELFRYRGPKPRSREAGVVLLADSVESASRTLTNPTPTRIRNLVEEITLNKLLDGQFSESGLTLTDIDKVKETLIRVLTAIFHSRVRYPERAGG